MGQKSEVWKDVNSEVMESSGLGSNSQTGSYSHSLPKAGLSNLTKPLGLFRTQHRSPLYQVADALKSIEMDELETINPFTLTP